MFYRHRPLYHPRRGRPNPPQGVPAHPKRHSGEGRNPGAGVGDGVTEGSHKGYPYGATGVVGATLVVALWVAPRRHPPPVRVATRPNPLIPMSPNTVIPAQAGIQGGGVGDGLTEGSHKGYPYGATGLVGATLVVARWVVAW